MEAFGKCRPYQGGRVNFQMHPTFCVIFWFSISITGEGGYLKILNELTWIHIPPAGAVLQIFYSGCVTFKWNCPLWHHLLHICMPQLSFRFCDLQSPETVNWYYTNTMESWPFVNWSTDNTSWPACPMTCESWLFKGIISFHFPN